MTCGMLTRRKLDDVLVPRATIIADLVLRSVGTGNNDESGAELLQLELYGQENPYRNRFLADARGLEEPLRDGFHRRVVEIAMSGGSLDQDFTDAAVGKDLQLEQRGALGAQSSR
jgi:hypothetical protein